MRLYRVFNILVSYTVDTLVIYVLFYCELYILLLMLLYILNILTCVMFDNTAARTTSFPNFWQIQFLCICFHVDVVNLHTLGCSYQNERPFFGTLTPPSVELVGRPEEGFYRSGDGGSISLLLSEWPSLSLDSDIRLPCWPCTHHTCLGDPLT